MEEIAYSFIFCWFLCLTLLSGWWWSHKLIWKWSLFYSLKSLGRIGIDYSLNDRTYLWIHIALGFSLSRSFWLLIQSPYLLLVCSGFLFLLDSVWIGCVFLGLCTSLLGYPICSCIRSLKKLKNKLPYDPSRCVSKGNKTMISNRCLQSHVYCCIIHNSQDMQTT